MIPNILSIAGTDPTGGAGIQADLKTFGALKCYGMAAVTAVVAQNTQGVRSFTDLDPQFVADQIDAVFEDVQVDAVKIGMIANAAIAEQIAERLRYYKAQNIVLDPVMVATSGDHLVRRDTVAAIRDLLVPLATIVTPNLPEAAMLLGKDPRWTLEEMYSAAAELAQLGSAWVLVKGGHLKELSTSPDILFGEKGTFEFSTPRINTTNDHGTGCTLSAAIAALLPNEPVVQAVQGAKHYLSGALAASDQLQVGKGRGPLNHFYSQNVVGHKE